MLLQIMQLQGSTLSSKTKISYKIRRNYLVITKCTFVIVIYIGNVTIYERKYFYKN